jgi:hypothetical protein
MKLYFSIKIIFLDLIILKMPKTQKEKRKIKNQQKQEEEAKMLAEAERKRAYRERVIKMQAQYFQNRDSSRLPFPLVN